MSPPPVFFEPPPQPPAPVVAEPRPAEAAAPAPAPAPAQPSSTPAPGPEPAPKAAPSVPATEPVPAAAPAPAAAPIEPVPGTGSAPDPAPAETERPPGLEAAPSDAPASGVLRPGTRRGFLTFAVGRSFLLETDGLSDVPRTSPGLMLEEAAGFVVKDRPHARSSLAFVFQQAFQSGPFDAQEFAFAPRVTFDIPLDPNLGVYLSPSILAGYNLSSRGGVLYDPGDDYYGNDDRPRREREHRFDAQFALAAKLLLADRLELAFRPLQLQIVTDFSEYSLRWNVLAGIGLTLG